VHMWWKTTMPKAKPANLDYYDPSKVIK